MCGLRVLVVGASIAGPATAYWLARAGARVTVIEHAKALRTNGQAIDIRSIGVNAMRMIPGMEAAVRGRTVPIAGINFVGSSGRPYATIGRTGDPDQQSLVSEFEILRGDLSRILYDLTKDDNRINYVFREQVAAIAQPNAQRGGDDAIASENAAPVIVEFENGSPRTEYDLVVACDGAHSKTRALGLGSAFNKQKHIHSTNCWAAYFTLKDNLLAGTDNTQFGHAYSAPGGRWAALGPFPNNNGSLGTFMKYSLPGNEQVMVPFREASSSGTNTLKDYISETYRGAGWKVNDILDGMKHAEDFHATEIVQVRLPCFHKGSNFALVGDAGYAGAAGAGTSLALAGAYILAGEIKRAGAGNGGDLATALNAYSERMRPIVQDLQKTPPMLHTIMAPQTAVGVAVRNALFGVVSWSGVVGLAHRFLGGVFENPEKFKLPEYGFGDKVEYTAHAENSKRLPSVY
ncbi:hypothetical protein BDV19DRAFT_382512 [Aspergillus venezuelensis]